MCFLHTQHEKPYNFSLSADKLEHCLFLTYVAHEIIKGVTWLAAIHWLSCIKPPKEEWYILLPIWSYSSSFWREKKSPLFQMNWLSREQYIRQQFKVTHALVLKIWCLLSQKMVFWKAACRFQLTVQMFCLESADMFLLDSIQDIPLSVHQNKVYKL